jgi:hypothetical protein
MIAGAVALGVEEGVEGDDAAPPPHPPRITRPINEHTATQARKTIVENSPFEWRDVKA